MSDNNEKTELVNPPRRGRGRPRKEPVSATNNAPTGLAKHRKSNSKAKSNGNASQVIQGHFRGTPKTATPPQKASQELIFALACKARALGIELCAERAGTESLPYFWDRSYWRRLDTEADKDAPRFQTLAWDWLKLHFPASAKVPRADALVEAALIELDALPRRDEERALIPCLDVYLDITPNGIFAVPAEQKHGLTYSVPVACGAKLGAQYTPKPVPADSRFGRFLSSMLPDARTRELVQEQCGRTLVPRAWSKCAWWVGAGKNGKSTLSALLAKFHALAGATRLDKLGGNFDLERLLGCSLVTVDEVKKSGTWDEALFKSLIAWADVSIDRKYKQALSASIRAHWVICSNQNVFATDNTDGVWRRIEIVRWTEQVSDDEVKAGLENLIWRTEKHIVLDWLLAGALRQVQRGRCRTDAELPASCLAEMKKSRHGSDSVRAWVDEMKVSIIRPDDMLIALADAWCDKERVLASYVEWCALTQREALKAEVFWRNLRQMPGFEVLEERQLRVNGKRARFVNIQPTSEGDTP